VDVVAVGKGHIGELGGQGVIPEHQAQQAAHGRRAVIGIPAGECADLHRSPVVAFAVQQRHQTGGEVHRRLQPPAIDEAIFPRIALIPGVDEIAGALPVVHVRVGEVVRQHHIDHIGGFGRVRQVPAGLLDQPEDLLAAALPGVDLRRQRVEHDVELGGMGAVAVRDGANGQVGQPQRLIRQAGGQRAERFGHQLCGVHQVSFVDRRHAGHRRQRAPLHPLALRRAAPDRVIDVLHPACRDLLRRQQQGVMLLDQVHVQILDIGVIVG